jgi:RNA polymerase sigma-70 factor (ECF subfamily)
VLGRTADAEDAAQEAIIRAWRKHEACTGAPEPWVRAIAGREALRILARRREAPLEAAPEPADRHDEDLELERMALRAELARLPEDDRRLLHATYWEDLTGADLSRRLGRPEATIRVRLHRSRRRLQRSVGHALGRVG